MINNDKKVVLSKINHVSNSEQVGTDTPSHFTDKIT